ncbi:uncharacterized protein LOC121486959 [Vulpes lagopus]|uniref:uncharacterized protein LOC121486959 n=1 Tax=Vulpes lagopus TaxID=494514 RepID=UPI001BC9B34E|nr:uncharacterized protein LOC121486959 [Vulpes lagopus]
MASGRSSSDSHLLPLTKTLVSVGPPQGRAAEPQGVRAPKQGAPGALRGPVLGCTWTLGPSRAGRGSVLLFLFCPPAWPSAGATGPVWEIVPSRLARDRRAHGLALAGAPAGARSAHPRPAFRGRGLACGPAEGRSPALQAPRGGRAQPGGTRNAAPPKEAALLSSNGMSSAARNLSVRPGGGLESPAGSGLSALPPALALRWHHAQLRG